MNLDSAYNYIVAGLTVRSEIELPELVPSVLANDAPDIEISFASVPESLPGATQATFESEIADNDVLLKIPEVARYFIRGGRQILVEAASHVEAKHLRLFLLGSALGAIFFQRGDFPLHASVAVVNGNGVAFTGDSGAGKSTMAAWMNAHGYPLLCDDVCVVRFDENDRPMAHSGFPRLKLWRDTLNSFAIDTQELQRDYFRADKYHLPVENRFCHDPVPLQHIVILQFTDAESTPCLVDIMPAQAVHLLRDNTYRYQYISGLGLTSNHFLDCVRLARGVRCRYLNRPKQLGSLAECQALIEQLTI